MRLRAEDPAAIEHAAALLAACELVAFPTETVYGLGARADVDAAVAKVFAAKGRPPGHPLIVHVADPADAAFFAAELPPLAQRLIAAFWPGPLTVIVPRAEGVATAAAGGAPTIGLRCPANAHANALLAAARRRGVAGVAAPSANRFGRVSPTLAAHVESEFGPGLALLDGGACRLGIESAIVDCSRGRAVLLRPGVLTRADIEAAAGAPLQAADADAPRAPGTLASHYAPRARVEMMSAAALAAALHAPAGAAPGLAVYSRTPQPGLAPGVRHRRMADDAASAAHELFEALRALDATGAQSIWVEEPPPGSEWDGVRDRLRRAAAC